MARICVLIGEGKSEKAFLSSLLIHKSNFTEYEQKNCILYQSKSDNNLFWIFPVPSLGSSHRGGLRLLENEKRYIEAKSIVANYNKWAFEQNSEIHYAILTDTDNQEDTVINERKEKIQLAFNKANVLNSGMHIMVAHIEIESWFLAGLTRDFPHLINPEKIDHIIAQNPDTIINPKEVLDSILVESISGSRQRIGTDFGEYIDLDQAIAKSESFRSFITTLRSNNLFE